MPVTAAPTSCPPVKAWMFADHRPPEGWQHTNFAGLRLVFDPSQVRVVVILALVAADIAVALGRAGFEPIAAHRDQSAWVAPVSAP